LPPAGARQILEIFPQPERITTMKLEESGSQRSRMETLDLETVLELARRGEEQALGELHRRFARRVRGLCRHLLRSAESAEDASSEVFVRVARMLTSYNGSVPFERWLFSIASHHCIDLLRKQQRERRWLGEEDVEVLSIAIAADSPLNELIREERREAVREALAKLPGRFRVPLALRYYGEFSYEEIAQQLHLTRANVATLVFRAKQELRQVLATHGGK
jgi:RNA polymerase sigma-70 factor (ECF subfamily)